MLQVCQIEHTLRLDVWLVTFPTWTEAARSARDDLDVRRAALHCTRHTVEHSKHWHVTPLFWSCHADRLERSRISQEGRATLRDDAGCLPGCGGRSASRLTADCACDRWRVRRFPIPRRLTASPAASLWLQNGRLVAKVVEDAHQKTSEMESPCRARDTAK